MKNITFLLAAYLTFTALAIAQTETVKPKDESSVEWLIAPSIPQVDLEIKNFKTYTNLPQGSQIFGGRFPFVSWDAEFVPSDSDDPLKSVEAKFTATPQSSKTVVVIGDFKIQEDLETKKKFPRAKVEVFENDLNGKPPFRLVVVNGMPEKELVIAFEGDAEYKMLLPFESLDRAKLPQKFKLSAKTGTDAFNLPFEFVENYTSAIIVFYLKDGRSQYKAISMNTL
jgi:hypothetical protein